MSFSQLSKLSSDIREQLSTYPVVGYVAANVVLRDNSD